MPKLIFGQKLKRVKRTNPLIAAYGPGPENKRCCDCTHLFAKRYAKTYWKCDKRFNTNGAKTDHGKTFPACGAFQPLVESAPDNVSGAIHAATEPPKIFDNLIEIQGGN